MGVEEKQYTVAQVSNILKVNPETVRRWIKTGKLQARLADNKAKIVLQSDLNKFLGDTPKYAQYCSQTNLAFSANQMDILAAFAITSGITSKKKEICDLQKKIEMYEKHLQKCQNELACLEKLRFSLSFVETGKITET